MSDWERILTRGLIVSCQAIENEPLHGSEIMARMALAAWQGGAVGIRANSPADIRAMKKLVNLPVIGIYKMAKPGFDVVITPTFAAAKEIAQAGADIIALDATGRARPGGETIEELIRRIKTELKRPVMADVSILEEGVEAARLGAEAVATTLSGYTSYSPQLSKPDFALVEQLVAKIDNPVIAEGRYDTPELAAQALRLGAYAVVVGTAITRPKEITRRFVKEIERILGKT